MKRYVFLFSCVLVVCGVVSAQGIVTADAYFQTVSDAYATFDDYIANITISSGQSKMIGKLSFRKPELLRIDFTSPAGQVIVFNKSELLVYLPDHQAVLRQAVNDGMGGVGVATGKGLSLLRNNFSIAFYKSPSPEALDEGSPENVVKFLMKRKGSSEGFSKLVISVNPDTKMIRRIEGTTSGGITTFDFTDMRVNVGVSADIFGFNIPGTANVYENFLFKTE